MKVLHLPANIASQMSVTVRSLNRIGVEARGITLDYWPYADFESVEIYEHVSRRRHPLRGTLSALRWRRVLKEAIGWADVIHWHFGMTGSRTDWDLKEATRLNKGRIVEFWGSDLRVPEIAAADNPYYAEMKQQGKGTAECYEQSMARQSKFASYGCACLIPNTELEAYVSKELFPHYYTTRARLVVSDYSPAYPDPNNTRPLVIHSPTNKGVKGTEAIVAAVERLQQEFSFDFELVYGRMCEENMEILSRADVLIDQVIYGSYGTASLEAMAFGKPSVCYMKPSVMSEAPAGFPIVNSTQEELDQVLRGLLQDGQHRHDLGRRSREYIEQYHDGDKLAEGLVEIYEEVIAQQMRRDVELEPAVIRR